MRISRPSDNVTVRPTDHGLTTGQDMHIALNLLLISALVALIGFGGALYWIARQDDSKTGRTMGVFAIAGGASIALYVALGRHWF